MGRQKKEDNGITIWEWRNIKKNMTQEEREELEEHIAKEQTKFGISLFIYTLLMIIGILFFGC